MYGAYVIYHLTYLTELMRLPLRYTSIKVD